MATRTSTSDYIRLSNESISFLPDTIYPTNLEPPNHRSMASLFRRDHGLSAGRRKTLKLLVLSYAPDWILTLVLAAAFLSLDKVSGFKREFSVSDTSLLHPFAEHERVPDWALYIIAIVSPLILQWLIDLATIRSWWDAHNSALGVVLGLSITGSITQLVKITVGRPRPDLISRCRPDAGTVDPPLGLSSVAICHPRTTRMIEDGFRSFPSGHSSLSFAGLGFLAFYIAGKTHLFDKRGHAAKAWLALLPLSGAALVAISRTEDYRHHWQDVFVGSLLGIVVAYFSYRQYYPPLSSELSHRPYAPRIHSGDPILPVHRQSPSNASVETVSNAPPYRDSIDDGNDVELVQGTVRRTEPGPLREVWRQGDEETAAANA
ncbi:PAP2-domain-containing protein [Auriscalpium vulgare]|uniref:PAP2-domain-containing protein n=1 Tax=Auriscalpium vulgare TaxID=40419 RepID=A0ACB8RS12_9AGAM|nr:PAP2-domain-containing protein [Auriscalpium vulgare]